MRIRLILVLLALSIGSISRAQTTKKLIEFGWDEPDAAFMRAHVAQMEQTPFDGTVFHVSYRKPDGSSGSFMGECWSARAFTADELQPALEDLKATPFKRFTHNFLRFNVCPGNVDWVDDRAFAAVIENARLAARVAHEGHAKGILFDIEQYNEPLWTYSKQPNAKTTLFDDYRVKVRERGREFQSAIQEAYPGITVFLTFGYSLALEQTNGDVKRLPEIEYALLPAFLDGMVDAAAPGTKIVDGYEIAYRFKTKADFDTGLAHMRAGALPYVADPKKYREVFSSGFGLWMDYDWRKNGWDIEHLEKNFFTPPQFEQSVRLALQTGDEYVWVYTETPKWWTPPDGKPEKLPQAYMDAVKRARE